MKTKILKTGLVGITTLILLITSIGSLKNIFSNMKTICGEMNSAQLVKCLAEIIQ